MSGPGGKWLSQFYATLSDDRAAALDLRDASLRSDLGRWTSALTTIVVRSFERLGLAAAGKGHRCAALPVKRNEYLGQDVMVFPASGPTWRFPSAVLELENSKDVQQVAYSLWKVLCVRCELRVVFCYRPEPDDGPALVTTLTANVVDAMTISDRSSLTGDTLVVMGSRNEAETFPYGFFQAWRLNANTGRFEHFARP